MPRLTTEKILIALVLSTTVLAALQAGATEYPFFDSFEGGLSRWTTDGAWGTTTAHYWSPAQSATDSPYQTYSNSSDSSLTLASPLDLTGASHPTLAFWHRYEIEAGYDGGSVEISADGGTTWTPVLPSYSGEQASWLREQVDLTDYAGEPDVRIRFRLVSDESVTRDGWYVDDVVIGERPASAVLDPPQILSANSIRLTWSPPSEPRFQCYRILRTVGSSLDWHTATVLAELEEPGQSSFTDVSASPKTPYTYVVMTVTVDGLHSLSETQTVTTPPGVSYPFLDDAEGSGSNWVATGSWAITDEVSTSGSHCWTDSPGGPYPPGPADSTLTLVNPLDLSAAFQPVLSFTHMWDFGPGDLGSVEYSTDGGATWTSLALLLGDTSSGWRRARFDLTPLAGSPAVLLRFRITADASGTGDGWHIDDISVAESPETMGPPALDQITSYSMRVSWPSSPDSSVSGYAVFRDLTEAVGINSTLAALISEPDVTSFTDSGLAAGTTYFYRVYAVNRYGTFSPDSPLPAEGQTGATPLPFFDDFEGALDAWQTTGAWGITHTDSFSGSGSLTDSPGTVVVPSASGTTSAALLLDLSGTTWPVLRFWDRLATGYPSHTSVVISRPDTSESWARYRFRGHRAWAAQSIDLSPWRTAGQVKLSFRLTTSGSSGLDDGWYIDDVSVAENPPSTTQPPFWDGAESGMGQWLGAGWTLSGENPFEGLHSFVCPAPGVEAYTFSFAPVTLTLASELDLSASTSPQLAFAARGNLGSGVLSAEVSTDGGLSWTGLPGLAVTGEVPTWRRYQASLEGFRQSGLRLRLRIVNGGSTDFENIALDDISIREAPPAVTLDPPVADYREIGLSWSETALGADFDHYEVRRGTQPGVSLQDALVCSSADPQSTSCLDGSVDIGTVYSYRVFVVDRFGVAGSSNEVQASTRARPIPFVDPMEDFANWSSVGDWTLSSHAYQGDSSIAFVTAPGHWGWSYLVTSVDMTGSSWPVLSFWDAGHHLAEVKVEVSPDGQTWTPVLSTYPPDGGESPPWTAHEVDLSPWKASANLRLRFAVRGDIGGEWWIDQLAVADHSGAVTIPFFDSLESGPGAWLSGSWVATTDSPHSGSWCLTSASAGAPIVEHALELGGEIDLSGVSQPVLAFWVAGQLGTGRRFLAQASTDGGLTWLDLPGSELVGPWSGGWTRIGLSLAGLDQPGVRLRFLTGAAGPESGGPLRLDDVTIRGAPEAVTLETATPGFRSVSLSWTTSTLGAEFSRYEVYRASVPGVTSADTLVGVVEDVDQTSLSDTDLFPGTTYYYAVAAVDREGAAALSNELAATTDVLHLPVSDPMETLTNWVRAGDWEPDPWAPHGGAASLRGATHWNPSTGVEASEILTVLDLGGTIRPVLSFWDRFDLTGYPETDWLLVSPDGQAWTRVYGVHGTRMSWSLQEIDLSPWRASGRLFLKFLTSGTSTTPPDRGWWIDDLSVEDLGPRLVSLPFVDGGEQGFQDWTNGGWGLSSELVHGGSTSFRSTPEGSLAAFSERCLSLSGELDLTTSQAPALAFWQRGRLESGTTFSVETSEDSGLTWTALFTEEGPETHGAWVRRVVPLHGLVGSTPRVRLCVRSASGWSSSDSDVLVDDLIVAEQPEPAVLNAPDQVTRNTMRLSWSASGNANFGAFELLRSPQAAFAMDTAELVAIITDPGVTSFVDSGLQPGRTYSYRLDTVDTAGMAGGSNTVSARTSALGFPFSDDMETQDGAWAFSGGWGYKQSGGIAGPSCLSRAPSGYSTADTGWAVTAVDLGSAQRPVLTFSDRLDLDSVHATLEVSVDEGDHWTTISRESGSTRDWEAHTFDLSPWRDASSLWLRFRSSVDSWSGPGWESELWDVDGLSIEEDPVPADIPPAPFIDSVEAGDTWWIPGQWSLVEETTCARGSSCFEVLVPAPYGPASNQASFPLTWRGSLDLSGTTDPVLTFWSHAELQAGSGLRPQVSTDGGRTWQDLPFSPSDLGTSWPWTRCQASLAGYEVAGVRLRFLLKGGSAGLDDIGLGPENPSVPVPERPADGADVLDPDLSLVVTNSADYQFDGLSYEFEVYDDAGLTHLVAHAEVGEGPGSTSWKIAPALPTGTQYWWRCRAVDDHGHPSAWSSPRTFFLAVSNHPPTVPVPVAPANGTQFTDLTGNLAWLASQDPDSPTGDRVTGYHLQVDEDPSFASPVIDEPAIPDSRAKDTAVSVALASLPGSSGFTPNTAYYWRVSASDTHGASSGWSEGPTYFVYGSDDQAPQCTIQAPAPGETLTSAPVTVTGTAVDDLSGTDLVEVSTDGGSTWSPASGLSSWYFSWIPENNGDYELRCRARDVAGNQGTSSSPVPVHVAISRSVSFSVEGLSVVESQAAASLPLVLAGPCAVPVTVGILVTGGTAEETSDYITPPESVTFVAGQTVASVTVPIVDDNLAEPAETVVLSLSSPSPPGVTLGPVTSTTIHILNDDSPADLNLDGAVDGADVSSLVQELFDLDGIDAQWAPEGAHPGRQGYDLDGDTRLLCPDLSEEIRLMSEPAEGGR